MQAFFLLFLTFFTNIFYLSTYKQFIYLHSYTKISRNLIYLCNPQKQISLSLAKFLTKDIFEAFMTTIISQQTKKHSPYRVLSFWRRSGSNRRPPQCHCGALPTELRPRRIILNVLQYLLIKASIFFLFYFYFYFKFINTSFFPRTFIFKINNAYATINTS